MRIAQIAPITEDVPPRKYGGTERVVSYLTEELVALGHDVTLFASGGSTTAAALVPMVPQAVRLSVEPINPTPYYMILLCYISTPTPCTTRSCDPMHGAC
jgi:hypothetical protein